MRRTLLSVAVVALAMLGVPALTAAPAATAATGPCGTTTTPPTYSHVTGIFMENHSFGDILFNHYSLLGTTEQLLGLPALGQASSSLTMTTAFNL